MREGLFEMQLLSADGTPFEEKEGFVLASPGLEYSVRILLHRDHSTSKFPLRRSKIKIGLYVDGVDVQYWKRLDLSAVESDRPAEVQFWGFKQKTDDLKAFVFSSPKCTQSSSTSAVPSRDNALGQLQVVIFEADETTEVFTNQVNTSAAPTEHYVSESKKFWQQASLGTCGGRSLQKETFKPIVRWNNVTLEPAKILFISYHTEDMLMLMQKFERTTSDRRQSSSSAISTSATGASNKRLIDLTDGHSDSEFDASRKLQREDDDDEVRVVSVEKEIPMVDISGNENEPVWTALRVQRGV
jgi:hypothetical protein